jgi:hypothetical protein
MSDMESNKKQEKKQEKNIGKIANKIELQPTTLEKGDTFRKHIDDFFDKSFLERVLPTGKK